MTWSRTDCGTTANRAGVVAAANATVVLLRGDADDGTRATAEEGGVATEELCAETSATIARWTEYQKSIELPGRQLRQLQRRSKLSGQLTSAAAATKQALEPEDRCAFHSQSPAICTGERTALCAVRPELSLSLNEDLVGSFSRVFSEAVLGTPHGKFSTVG
jgi:hypothetical protein